MNRFLPLFLLVLLAPTAAFANNNAGPMIIVFWAGFAGLVLLGVICGCVAAQMIKGPRIGKFSTLAGGLALSGAILKLIYWYMQVTRSGRPQFLTLDTPGPLDILLHSIGGQAVVVAVICAAITYGFSRLAGILKEGRLRKKGSPPARGPGS